VCKNNAILNALSNTPGSCSCICKPGFAGKDCSIRQGTQNLPNNVNCSLTKKCNKENTERVTDFEDPNCFIWMGNNNQSLLEDIPANINSINNPNYKRNAYSCVCKGAFTGRFCDQCGLSECPPGLTLNKNKCKCMFPETGLDTQYNSGFNAWTSGFTNVVDNVGNSDKVPAIKAVPNYLLYEIDYIKKPVPTMGPQGQPVFKQDGFWVYVINMPSFMGGNIVMAWDERVGQWIQKNQLDGTSA